LYYIVIKSLKDYQNEVLNKCKEALDFKLKESNDFFYKLGINYKKFQLVAEKAQQKQDLGQLLLYVPLFMKNIWEDPKSLAKIISKINPSDLMDLSYFIIHNLYYNIFYSKKNDHQLIYIISLLLKDEISKLADDDINNSSFLNKTSCGIILEQFLYAKDVQSFFKANLTKVIKKIEMEKSNSSIILNPEDIQKKIDETKLCLDDNSINENKTSKIKEKMSEVFAFKYFVQMNETLLKEKLNSIKDIELKEVYEKKSSDFINSTNCNTLIANIIKFKKSDKIFLFYINSHNEIIEIINMILDNLFKNVNSLPYSIKSICKITLFKEIEYQFNL
jgi:hypothetical protein